MSSSYWQKALVSVLPEKWHWNSFENHFHYKTISLGQTEKKSYNGSTIYIYLFILAKYLSMPDKQSVTLLGINVSWVYEFLYHKWVHFNFPHLIQSPGGSQVIKQMTFFLH